ncbi:MAG: DUF1743 domain-containing protein, partial [Thermoplasmata archaeon]|nr:DUF1743 domain-containing protein [Thermoplasmata archaeon]
MWIGVDDTDGPNGGCTTFVLTEIVRTARAAGADLIGEPRLVRLNPNIPWKTRGNAALAARFGHGIGTPRRIGAYSDGPIWAYPRGRRLQPKEQRRLARLAWTTILRSSETAPGTDPAMVAAERRPGPGLYRRAVGSVVPIHEVVDALQRIGATRRARSGRRGLVGATAAIAWPAKRFTWELIAYRRGPRRAGARTIDLESVRGVERRYPALFLCTDRATRRMMLAPHTACPILLGLRSRKRSVLPPAFRALRSEPWERWIIFQTNQGTGDHLVRRTVARLGPYESGRIRGTVASSPEQLRGGHVRFRLADARGEPIACLAFEPTKTLPVVARGLAIGDTVEVWGGRGRDSTLRLEGIRVLKLVPRTAGKVPPSCPDCGRRARSMGRGRGYRCRVCRRRFPPEAARSTVRAPSI